jgi:hypothetical protein
VNFAAITLYVASERVIPKVSAYFVNRLSPETFGYTLVHLCGFRYKGSMTVTCVQD